MIYKVKITYKIINLQRVPGSCIKNKEFERNLFIYIYMVFTAEGFFEVAMESWPEWDLNPRPYALTA